MALSTFRDPSFALRAELLPTVLPRVVQLQQERWLEIVLLAVAVHCSSQQHVLPSKRGDILLEEPQITRAREGCGRVSASKELC